MPTDSLADVTCDIWGDDADLSDEALLEACLATEAAAADVVPLRDFRRGYLWVSDLSAQLWCEQQVHYRHARPDLRKPEPVHVARGSDMHLSRELETQSYVDVAVESDEDVFAVKVLNLWKSVRAMMLGLADGGIQREVPVFGFFADTLFLGKIDELRLNSETYTLEVAEFKTRASRRLPGGAQRRTHAVQVMMYKHLIDDLVTGRTKAAAVLRRLRLDGARPLGAALQTAAGADDGADATADREWTLSAVLARLCADVQGLPLVSDRLRIDYAYQEKTASAKASAAAPVAADGASPEAAAATPFATDTVVFDEAWLAAKALRCLEYWRGERQPEGVEVEEAWKCGGCDYEQVCQWREKKMREIRDKRNRL